MEVTDRRAEKDAPDGRKDRVAEIAVQGRHRAGRDPAPETVAHDEVGAAAQLLHEGVEPGEIVAVVAVAHDDVAPARRRYPRAQSGAVALHRHVDDPRAERLGHRLAAVGGAVIGNHDFPADATALQEPLRLSNAGLDRLRLVQAGHEDRQLGHCGVAPVAVRCPGLPGRLIVTKRDKDGGNWEIGGRSRPHGPDAAVSSRLRRAFVALPW
jgi:hypothetical protein